MLTPEVSYTRHFKDQDNLYYQNDAPLRRIDYSKVSDIADSLLEERNKEGKRDIVLVSSIKRRAFQTAELVANLLEGNCSVNIVIDPRIREIDQGQYILPQTYEPGDHFDPLEDAWLAYIEQVSEKSNMEYSFGNPFVEGELLYPELHCWERYGECQYEFAGRYYDFLLDLQKQRDQDRTSLYSVFTHQALIIRTAELRYLMSALKDRVIDYKPGRLGRQEWDYLRPAETLCDDFTDYGGTGKLDLEWVLESRSVLEEELKYLRSLDLER